ncbi:hypothetical protein SAMN06265784_102784 [Paraburkholderia susongensis]|uniref:Uncharacterized protein n=1 Tax=Paraburkholderia susongensis TaxID=1515439 RepID=A0A1X7JKF0_9BURK|nr:hypothetical protein [Paraburkholderia susongensis]SMG28652.1 hypothetical protein SAMN06265784_102784 [Paraburkholderia susongensis]
MFSVRSLQLFKSVLTTAVAAALTTVCAVPGAFAASTASDSARRPVTLDTLGGVNNGQSGTVLMSAPPSVQPIVAAPSIAAPVELPRESSPPFVVAPYIQLPAGGGVPPRPMPRPIAPPQ